MQFTQPKDQIQITILALVACFGILYLAPKILSSLNVGPHDYFDFQLLWAAGKIWAAGQNPYTGEPLATADILNHSAVSPGFTRHIGTR